MAKVVLEDVTKKFGNNIVVNKQCLEIQDKEFIILVGPSGCGKSTTLRMIAGLEDITSGNIYIDNDLVNDVPPKDRDIAMVFQNYALYPHMNVFGNMAFALTLRKVPKDEIRERVDIAAEMLGIKDLLDRKPSQLSGGQRQRVALGRAVVREPKVFLMDEPLSNLDAKLRVQMRTEIQKLHARLQTTIIYVTHDQVEAMTMGDRVVVLNKGAIQQVDTPLNLYNNPVNMFVAGFIGSPAMNFVDCKLVKENDKYLLVNEKIRLILNKEKITKGIKNHINQDVVLGIRPEHIAEDNNAGKVGENQNLVDVLVDVVEPMGSETFIYFDLSGKTFVAKVGSKTGAMVGKAINFFY
ncbi:putative multiple sugar ABC transporter (ATP-binding protein) [Syntrophaceticus schinkii]|uniref:Putative multiple sugar ABC transporter (ATP-binding protein) n=1 Tax=Syntrophaceticus schinkii TaxID=499207 RepID=A0A0B7MCH3_9FIRM|nr:putative multiple sugar ABC transporter (ATP-binding protein) [Syntrophaceticus schinkii]